MRFFTYLCDIITGTTRGGENVQGQTRCSACKGYCQTHQNVRRKSTIDSSFWEPLDPAAVECPTFHQNWVKVARSVPTLELVGFSLCHSSLVWVTAPPSNTKRYNSLVGKKNNSFSTNQTLNHASNGVAQDCCLWMMYQLIWFKKRYYTRFQGQRGLCASVPPSDMFLSQIHSRGAGADGEAEDGPVSSWCGGY